MNPLKSLPMRRQAARLALLLLFALLASPALPLLGAEAAEGHGSPWLAFAYKVVNFAILVGFLVYFLRGPLGRFLTGSAKEAIAAFLGTRGRAEEAAAALEQQKQKIAGLENELNQMVGDARGDAENERRQMIEEAGAQAERIKAASRRQVEQEFLKARNDLRAELADRTVALAADLIRARLDDPQRERLVGEFIEQLGGRP